MGGFPFSAISLLIEVIQPSNQMKKATALRPRRDASGRFHFEKGGFHRQYRLLGPLIGSRRLSSLSIIYACVRGIYPTHTPFCGYHTPNHHTNTEKSPIMQVNVSALAVLIAVFVVIYAHSRAVLEFLQYGLQ